MPPDPPDLQSQTRAYYSSGIVPEWLGYVYNDLERSTQFPFGAARRLVVQHAVADHSVQPGAALDIGCGGGQLSVDLAKQGFSVHAFDFSAPMLEEARRLTETESVAARVTFARHDLVRDDVAALKVAADFAIAMGFVEYLDDIGEFFEKCARLLNPGGRLLVEFRNRMFNAVTGNRFTLAEAEQGDLAATVAAFQDFCTTASVTAAHFAELAAAFEAASAILRRVTSPPRDVDLSQPFPVARRQHLVPEIENAARSAGFRLADLYGLHPHPVAPGLERHGAWQFNQIAWRMQHHPRNPLVVSTCSSLAALLVRE